MTYDTLVAETLRRPQLYQQGANLWTHPHIASEMLKLHLSPDTDAASYRPQTVQAICDHLRRALTLRAGDALVDLGCGPGLYCRQFARAGISVTGMDQSASSLTYAQKLCEGLPAQFRQGDYLEPFGRAAFDAAVLIWQDYGVLSPHNRQRLLRNIHAALKPGGRFALDVPTPVAFEALRKASQNTWETAACGFWRPHPCLVLHADFFFSQAVALCQKHVVLDDELTVYLLWQTFFTPERLRGELETAGFVMDNVWGSLTGEAWTVDAPAIGLLCHRPD